MNAPASSVICRWLSVQGPLEQLRSDILTLRRGTRRGHTSPHKLLLLLAVLDLAEDGLLRSNRIYFDDYLISRFERNFTRFGGEADMCQPAPPFFHLRSAKFWHHEILPGREAAYRSFSSSGGGAGRIDRNIAYAYLSDYAYKVVIDPEMRRSIRTFIEEQLLRSQLEEASPNGQR